MIETERLIRGKDREWKAELSLSCGRDGEPEWEMLVRSRPLDGGSWSVEAEAFPENLEFVLSGMKRAVFARLDESFRAEARRFAGEIRPAGRQ